MRSPSESSLLLLLFIFSEVNPLLLLPVLLLLLVLGEVVPMGIVACRMLEMSPTKEEAVGGVRRDVI